MSGTRTLPYGANRPTIRRVNLRALVLLLLALLCALPAPAVRAGCSGAAPSAPAAGLAAGPEDSCCGSECKCTPEACACKRPERGPEPQDPTAPPAPREPFSLPTVLVATVAHATEPPAASACATLLARPRAPPVALHVRHCVWRT